MLKRLCQSGRLLLLTLFICLPMTVKADELADRAAAEVVMEALSLLGTPYKTAGYAPEQGFDCSGMVSFVYHEALDKELPRSADQMFHLDVPNIAKEELRAGDLLFFRIGKRSKHINHVALYLGDGRFIHSPASGGVVRIDRLDDKYWRRYFQGGRRVIDATLNMALGDTAPQTTQ